jgi:hypothetical protein
MTTISKDAHLITLINVFTVDPSNQSRLVELLTTVTDTFVRHARGFISSSLHRSRDGTKMADQGDRQLQVPDKQSAFPSELSEIQSACLQHAFFPAMMAFMGSLEKPSRPESSMKTLALPKPFRGSGSHWCEGL